ncbi:hypothetical protein JXA34_02495 [Patescibacteria group bacterium]|nr:hypothetical protein [Patescibacteria group bacterium]
MNMYIFGNQDISIDKIQEDILINLRRDFKEKLNFVYVRPNEDFQFENKESLIILDVVKGISKVTLLDEKDISKLKLSPRTFVHDFDLNFQLKYLKKLGKLSKIYIIGIPFNKRADYSSIHSIVKKLVAQDIQGS